MRIFLIGAVFFICCGWGLFESYKLNSRYKNLCYIKSSLSMMETHIRFSAMYMEKALYHSGIKENDLFADAARNISKKGAKKAWEDSVRENADALFLKEEDKNTLLLFSRGLGMTDETGQIKNIRYVCEMLERNISSAKDDCDKYSRLYCGGGVLTGLFLGLIMI